MSVERVREDAARVEESAAAAENLKTRAQKPVQAVAVFKVDARGG